MMDRATHIRRIEALLAKTVERGAFPHEAESAQRLARRLIERHGLQAQFNGHARPKSFVEDIIESFRAEASERIRRQREWDAHHEERMRQHNEDLRKADEARAKSDEDWQRKYERRKAAARRGAETRRRKERAAKLARYRGVAGTVQAVCAILNLSTAALLRGTVNEKHLAKFLDISENAAHGRLWRAVQAGALRKVEGGYAL